jgi:hypothetical protein
MFLSLLVCRRLWDEHRGTNRVSSAAPGYMPRWLM